MHVINAAANLNEKVEGSIFTQKLFLSNQIEQISFAGILQRKIDSLLILKTCVKSTDVFMV